MIRYHSTTPDAAASILALGFRDAEGSYMFVGITLRGVFLSLYPVDINEGAKGDVVLAVDLPDVLDLDPYAIREEGRDLWEWCVPASMINTFGTVRLLSEDERDEAWWRTRPFNPE